GATDIDYSWRAVVNCSIDGGFCLTLANFLFARMNGREGLHLVVEFEGARVCFRCSRDGRPADGQVRLCEADFLFARVGGHEGLPLVVEFEGARLSAFVAPSED